MRKLCGSSLMLTLPHQTSSRIKLAVDEEALRIELDVDVAPPDVVADLGLVDDALVGRAAPGLLARQRDQRAGRRDRRALLVPERGLVEERRRGVAMDLGDGDALSFERERHARLRGGKGSLIH